MNFSELFQQSNQLCKFSPNGRHVCSCSQCRVVIRDVATLQIVAIFTCADPVQYIEWASDSVHVMCGMFKRGMVQVWSIENSEWYCKIDEGLAGLVACRWAPDARHILTMADFQLRVTLWSLTTKGVSFIKNPKSLHSNTDFSKDGRIMAMVERRDCKDYVNIFDCSVWKLWRQFSVDTKDSKEIRWSPNNQVLCLWDSPLEYNIFIYSMDGQCLSSYSAYSNALGIKRVTWSPTSQFLAIGSFDEKVRIMNHLTWKMIVEHRHPSSVTAKSAVIYVEVERRLPGSQIVSESRYDAQEPPIALQVVKPDPDKPNPSIGVGIVLFSPDNRYLVTRNDNMPHAIWIWDMPSISLIALLVHTNPVKAVEWDPKQSRLALCTGTNKLYMWSPAGCISVVVPVDGPFKVNNIHWHPNGRVLVLLGKTHYCLCTLDNE